VKNFIGTIEKKWGQSPENFTLSFKREVRGDVKILRLCLRIT